LPCIDSFSKHCSDKKIIAGKQDLFGYNGIMLAEESIQSLGGKARDKALTASEKSEIAQKGAVARWSKPVAYFEGDLQLGPTTINCAVVEINGDPVRIISSRGFMQALGRPWKGTYERTGRPNFLEANNLTPFISNELESVLEMIEYRTPSGGSKRGYRAEVVPMVCEVYLEARQHGALHTSQLRVAKACEIITRGLARLGIVALVDEATGYQEVRDRLALRKILEKYVTDEWAKWTRRFPTEFYRQLFRLKNVPFPPSKGTKKPSYVGHWTNDVIYSRSGSGEPLRAEKAQSLDRQLRGSRRRIITKIQ
jgi:hypothetical protein